MEQHRKRAGALALGVAAMVWGGAAATAQQQATVASYIPGARCMNLALTHEQMMDTSLSVPMRAAPRPDAPAIGEPGATVIVRDGPPTNGFREAMLADGRTGWIEGRWLRPWTPATNPRVTCRPAVLSNGRYGFDIR